MDDDFFDLVLAIDAKKYEDGVLGKLDDVLRLSTQGYARENVLAGIDYVSRRIKNRKARMIAVDVYTNRVR